MNMTGCGLYFMGAADLLINSLTTKLRGCCAACEAIRLSRSTSRLSFCCWRRHFDNHDKGKESNRGVQRSGIFGGLCCAPLRMVVVAIALRWVGSLASGGREVSVNFALSWQESWCSTRTMMLWSLKAPGQRKKIDIKLRCLNRRSRRDDWKMNFRGMNWFGVGCHPQNHFCSLTRDHVVSTRVDWAIFA
jgi:hypothetical protein